MIYYVFGGDNSRAGELLGWFGTVTAAATLLVIPVFYTFFDDARSIASSGLKQALGRGKVGDPGSTAPVGT